MSGRRAFLKKMGLLATSGIAVNIPFISKGQESELVGASSTSSDDYWRLVRQEFHIREGYTFLNNGTMGPSPASVEQAVIESMRHVNTHIRYGGGEDVRDSLAQLIGTEASEISLTHNTTEGINIAAWGLPLSKGDEVIITRHEHVGNSMPWINRAKIDGIKIKVFYPKLNAADVLNQINDLIGPHTKVISIPHISCTIGQRFPVKEVCALARSKGIYTVIDGAHGAGSIVLDMKDIGADIYVSCGHKWLLGPKGTGFFYIRADIMDEVSPLFAGAYTDQGLDIMSDPPSFENYAPTAHRYDFGTQNAALRFGLKAACDFNQKIGSQKVQDRILGLSEYLRDQLLEIDSIELLTSDEPDSRSMMLGLRSKLMDYKELYKKLIDEHIRVRQVPEARLNSIRVSTHIYNSKDEIDRLVETLSKIG